MFRVELTWSALCRGLLCAACVAVAVPGAAAAAKGEGDGKSPPRAPNLLVIVTDDQRANDTLGAMPRTRKAFAQRSTRYPEAHVSTPLCCPSRATIFSGLYAHNHGVWTNTEQIPDQRRTVQNWLGRAGYRTGLVGKYLNSWPHDVRPPENPPHWDRFWINEGAHRHAKWNINGRLRKVKGHSTTFATKQVGRFIREGERKDGMPWFLFVAVTEPHGPLEPKRKYEDATFGAMRMTPAMTESDLSDKPRYLREQADEFAAVSPPPAEVRLAQLRLLQSVDDLVAATFRHLRRTGEGRDTLVVFTSDNGIHWGEHGGFVAKDLPYEASTHVPLLVRWPGSLAKRPPKTDHRLVSNVDVAPTLLDVAHVGKTHKVDGRSLRHRGWQRDYLLLEYFGFQGNGFFIPPWKALRNERELYVEYAPFGPYGAETEYYDLVNDPWGLTSNPAAAPAGLSAELGAAFHCRSPKTCP